MVFLGRLLSPWLQALRILPVALTLDNEVSKRKVQLPVATTAILSPRLSISGYEPVAKPCGDGWFRNNVDVTRGSVALGSVEDCSHDNDSSKPMDARQINCSIDVIDDVIFKSFDSIDDLNEKTRQEEGLRDMRRESVCLESGMNNGSRVLAGPSVDWSSASTGLTPYEMIRERNIAERERLFKELGLKSISKLGHLNGEAIKTKRRKKCKEKVEKLKDVKDQRKSARPKQSVSYNDKDPDWMPGAKEKSRKRKLKSMLDSYRNDNSETEETERRPKRSRKKATYDDVDIEPWAEFIYCDICQEAKHHGCKIHPVIFDYEFNFDVGPSSAGKNAGDGVFNNDSRPIPQGVMFGKYAGKFYNVNEYKKIKDTRGESGNAWGIRDRNLNKIVGYIDPGWKPDKKTNWMAYVNCATKKRFQNLWPGQYTDGIYYRTLRPIQFGEELLTYYGNVMLKD